MQRVNCIEHYQPQRPFQRLFVVGDVHGCYTQLMQALAQVDFDFSQDLLIGLGDLVDRGPESLKCLNLLQQPWFKAVLGNHEEMCLHSEHDRMMADLHCRHGGQWFYDLPLIERQRIIALVRQLPIVLEIEHQGQRIGFVHADVDLNHWEAFKAEVQRNPEAAVWGRGRIRNNRPHRYQAVKGIDRIFLGHTVVDQVTQRDNCYYIDTGAVFGKQLSVIEIDLQRPVEQQVAVIVA